MADQPATIADSFPALQAAFLPDRATGVDKTIQFNFSGRETGTWNMRVHDGAMDYAPKARRRVPNATQFSADSDDWLNILSGALKCGERLHGRQAQGRGRYGAGDAVPELVHPGRSLAK